MVGMDRNLSINEVNETGENRPQFQTEEELLHSMGYKQVQQQQQQQHEQPFLLTFDRPHAGNE